MALPEPKLARVLANIFAPVLPLLSAKIMVAYWIRTQRYPRPEREFACLSTVKCPVKQKNIAVNGENIMLYSWGSEDERPKVLLLHGWNGRATQYFAFVNALLMRGFSVLAFDAPGHGESGGAATNVLQIAGIVKYLDDRYGKFTALIGHSFGFFAAVNALEYGVRVDKLIGISSPADFDLLFQKFCQSFSLSEKSSIALSKLLKKEYKIESFEEISVNHLAKKQTVPCLIVHDKNDPHVSISEALKITKAWQNALLYVPTTGGHFRILYERAVVDRCMQFLSLDNIVKIR